MNDLQPFWKVKFYIGAYQVDMRTYIKLSHLTGLMQEAAWQHASHLLLGEDFLHKNKLVWMLSSIKLHLDYYPKWKENITIETWPKGLNRFFYLRDFVLYDQNENQFGIASTQWLLIDINSKRPKITETEQLLSAKDVNRHAFEEPIGKLPKIETGEEYSRSIEYADYDLNMHVNSNRYIDFILGIFPFEFHQQNTISDIQLNYVKEVKNVEQIILKKQAVNNKQTFFVEGLSLNKEITHFQSVVIFDQEK